MTDQSVGRIRCIDDEMTGGYFIAGQEYSLTRVGEFLVYAIDESGSEHKITSGFLAKYFEHVLPVADEITVGDWVEVIEVSDNVRKGMVIETNADFYHIECNENNIACRPEYLRKIDPPESQISVDMAHEYALANIAYVRKLAQEKALDIINAFIQSLGEVHLGDGVFITKADHEALQQMAPVQNLCLCGRFVGRTRLDAGLTDCIYCSAAAVRKQALHQKLIRRGLDISRANKIAFAGLTAHLRQIK